MPVNLPPGVGQAVMHIQLAGRSAPYSCTMGYIIGEDGAQGAAAAISQSWSMPSGVFVPANILVGYTYLGVTTLQHTGGEGSPLEQGSFAQNVVGTSTMPALPPNVAFLVRKTSSQPGRKGRGRMYLPPCVNIGEDSVSTTGALNASFMASLQGQITETFDAWVESGYPPALLHADGSDGVPISALILSGLVATQRRRMR